MQHLLLPKLRSDCCFSLDQGATGEEDEEWSNSTYS